MRLTFTTAGGKTFAITIPNPRVDLQQAEVMAVMDSIIASDLFLTSSGALTGIRDIKVIDTTTNDLFDPPPHLPRFTGTSHENELYFLNDPWHLAWKGWVAVDEKLNSFLSWEMIFSPLGDRNKSLNCQYKFDIISQLRSKNSAKRQFLNQESKIYVFRICPILDNSK
ncbi:MAG TPA: hypothetical protein DEF89_03390 [Desulfosporosinus sp.]|nr:hypothetical protein [Desulfosporosinus sp.]